MESTFLDKNHRRIYTQKRNDTIQKVEELQNMCLLFFILFVPFDLVRNHTEKVV